MENRGTCYCGVEDGHEHLSECPFIHFHGDNKSITPHWFEERKRRKQALRGPAENPDLKVHGLTFAQWQERLEWALNQQPMSHNYPKPSDEQLWEWFAADQLEATTVSGRMQFDYFTPYGL